MINIISYIIIFTLVWAAFFAAVAAGAYVRMRLEEINEKGNGGINDDCKI